MKTQAQIDKAASQRLQKTYGRDLAWYEEQFELQGRHCAICPDGPKTRRLHVDHDHHWVDVKIRSWKNGLGLWSAEAEYRGTKYWDNGNYKSDAIRGVKEQLKRASVRALLCHRCNRAMILFKDKSDVLRKAADYLDNFQAGRPLIGLEVA